MLFLSKNQLVPTTTNLALGFLSGSFLKQVASWLVVWRFCLSWLCQDDCGIYYAYAVLG